MAVKRWMPKRPQELDSSGNPYSGGKYFFYAAGTTTPQNTYTDDTGLTANANPVILDASGRPSTEIWLTAGLSYKCVFKTSADVTVWTEDDITGVNDASVTLGQWLDYSVAPTFVSTTSFTVPGDQQATFAVGTALKAIVTGSPVYTKVKAVAFTSLTTVTTEGAVLTSGLSAVATGIITASNNALPSPFDTNPVAVGSADITKKLRFEVDGFTTATTRVWTPPDADLNFFNRTGFVQIAEDAWLHNATLAVSVAANALTVALKTKAGADPSAADPVYIGFRDATLTTGTYTVLKVVAATSFVISSGSTLGTVSGQAHRIYVAGVNDAGTFRLGGWNPWDDTNKVLLGIDDNRVYSSTAEGGAGAADSAHVLYTGTAVTSKAVRVLGYFESTQATAGTWASEDSVVQIMGPGVHRTNDVILQATKFDGAMQTGTTTIPDDDTIPQNTEGNEFMTITATPTSAINLMEIEASLFLSISVTNAVLALFQDATANALRAIKDVEIDASARVSSRLSLFNTQVALSTSAITWKARAGGSTAGTITFNGVADARELGGVMNSYMRVKEIFA